MALIKGSVFWGKLHANTGGFYSHAAYSSLTGQSSENWPADCEKLRVSFTHLEQRESADPFSGLDDISRQRGRAGDWKISKLFPVQHVIDVQWSVTNEPKGRNNTHSFSSSRRHSLRRWSLSWRVDSVARLVQVAASIVWRRTHSPAQTRQN